MPARSSKSVTPTTTGTEVDQKFTRASLESFNDLDLKGVLRVIGLDEYTENFDRVVGIDRILQEQKHGFTVSNEELFQRFVDKAATVAVAPTPLPGGDKLPKDPKGKTVRTKVSTKGDDEQNEPGSLVAVAGQVGSVTYGIKEVKNIGNYESLHITVSITLPVNASADDIRDAQETMLLAKDLCVTQVENDMKELGL